MSGSNVNVVYTGFTEAFDKVSHKIILLYKLGVVGVCGPLLICIIFFVSFRTQIVRLTKNFGHFCT